MTAFDYTHFACDGDGCLDHEEFSGAYAEPPNDWTTEYIDGKDLHFCALHHAFVPPTRVDEAPEGEPDLCTRSGCGLPRKHLNHDGDRWPGRLSVNSPYHPFESAAPRPPICPECDFPMKHSFDRWECFQRGCGNPQTIPAAPTPSVAGTCHCGHPGDSHGETVLHGTVCYLCDSTVRYHECVPTPEQPAVTGEPGCARKGCGLPLADGIHQFYESGAPLQVNSHLFLHAASPLHETSRVPEETNELPTYQPTQTAAQANYVQVMDGVCAKCGGVTKDLYCTNEECDTPKWGTVSYYCTSCEQLRSQLSSTRTALQRVREMLRQSTVRLEICHGRMAACGGKHAVSMEEIPAWVEEQFAALTSSETEQ